MPVFEEQRAYLKAHQAEAQQRLLAWFAGNARDLPWRHNRTPYRVWISEVMLQQTQVQTVRDYYVRFMERLPTIEALAQASLQDVLKLWEGLGYYSRARALHRAARELLAKYGGVLPADVKALQQLPGIGAYTAGAIGSIAFGIPAPAIDGNVRRVMARVLALEKPSRAQLDAAIRLWMPEDAAGAFNEGLMEPGALICRPQLPACSRCPWQALCRARQAGQQEAFPTPKPRKRIPHYDVPAAITLRDDQSILVARRRQEDMLGGLWEFPGGKRKAGETLEEALRREIHEEMAIEIAVGELWIKVRHAYTHFRITLYAFNCRLVAGEPRCIECDDFRWATLDELDDLPMAVTDRKVAQVVKQKLA